MYLKQHNRFYSWAQMFTYVCLLLCHQGFTSLCRGFEKYVIKMKKIKHFTSRVTN